MVDTRRITERFKRLAQGCFQQHRTVKIPSHLLHNAVPLFCQNHSGFVCLEFDTEVRKWFLVVRQFTAS